MGGAEWNGAVALLKAWLMHQPAPMPILILLAAAFSLVMFVEGLRANFLPARNAGRRKIVSPKPQDAPETKLSNVSRPTATFGGSPIPRFVPKQQTALRRVYGAPRPAVCHRIKLEMVNLEPVTQGLPLADQD
jgi:hypothetical protein